MAVVALTGSVAASSPAYAASYNGSCGAGYSVVNSAAVGTLGTVFLTYNSSNGYNCAVIIRHKKVSSANADWMRVQLNNQAAFDGTVEDSGVYTSYAGPVYKYGKGHCMWWSGMVWLHPQKANTYKKKTNCG
ncbi:spore-associated protein A [Nonomuraea sp. ZG12]|uniref:spore-associated protein A n=1 Tax=Nonomuraea sp. ZG12 TaxID=3452207 RepID=UPI003F8A40BD